jgi:hypothetical protein
VGKEDLRDPDEAAALARLLGKYATEDIDRLLAQREELPE